MPSIIYDVAVSIDGYISGAQGDISQFAQSGPVVDDYVSRLGTYAAAIMGRATYEFGYAYGLEPGQNPYPHMQTYVVSTGLSLPPGDVKVIADDALTQLSRLKENAPGDIYLCGGGIFASACLAAGLIDRLMLKRAPILLGEGVALFAGGSARLTHLGTKVYDDGYLLQQFDVARPHT